MKGFKLYIYNNQKSEFLFSSYEPDSPVNKSLTFNETLEEHENNQFTLSFSFAKNLPNIPNNALDLTGFLRIGRVLKLECENHDGNNYIDFIITSISPVGKTDNIVYEVSAQDYASFRFSRNNIGLTFDSIEDEEWIGLGQENTIKNLGDFFLRRGHLQEDSWGWKIINDDDDIFNISLSDSNTYNALVEISNLTNTIFKINYNSKEIIFIKRDDISFQKNYQLSPNINLQDLSLNYNGEEFYTLLFVEGGQDDFGFNVGLTPTLPDSFVNYDWNNSPDLVITNILNKNYYDQFDEKEIWLEDYNTTNNLESDDTTFLDIINRIPYLDNFIIDLDYFDRNNLINANDGAINYNDLANLIFNNLRKENVRFQSIFRKKEKVYYEINKIENKIDTLAELMLKAEGQKRIDYDKEINDLFYYGSFPFETTKIISKGDTSLVYNANQWEYNGYVVVFDFPITFNSTIDGTTYSISSKTANIVEFIVTSGSYRRKFIYDFIVNSGAESKENLIIFDVQQQKSILIKLWDYVTPRTPNQVLTTLPDPSTFPVGYIIGIAEDEFSLPKEYYQITQSWTTWELETNPVITSEEWTNITISYASNEKIEKYKYFDLLSLYKGHSTTAGLNYPLDVLNKKQDYLIALIEERKSIEGHIINLKAKLLSYIEGSEPYKDIQTTIETRQADLDAYKEACGTWDYINNEFINDTLDTSDIGKYCIVYLKYKEYYDLWVATNPNENSDPVYNRYIAANASKNSLWFQIKQNYDQYLLEGYYSNDIEIDSVSLYNQAQLYFQKYKQPLDTYNITYIDITQIIGKNINAVSVGDYINIYNYNLGLIEQFNNQLTVTSISRDLRKNSDIQLTVDKIKNTQTIIEKIIKTIK